MATSDKSHLEWHGRQWRVTVMVPRALRPIIGRAHLKHPLGTADLTVANRIKWEHVARLKKLIEDAQKPVVKGGGPMAEARALRASLALSGAPSDYDHAAIVESRAEVLEAAHGTEIARTFAGIALGTATPITEHLEEFIGDWAYQPKSVLELRRAVSRLEEYLKANSKGVTLEAVDGVVAIGFMRDLVHVRKLSRRNAGKYISFLRTYWAWLADNHYLPPLSSPWTGKLPKDRTAGRHHDDDEEARDGGKRPYTDAELKVLLTGEPPRGSLYLSDLQLIAATSGMRIEEIYRLRVRDCADGFYALGDGKTKNAARRIPIHTAARKAVERLTRGRQGGEYLLDPSAPVVALTGIRSGAASKSFTRYRRGLGIDERPNDKAKSNVDFHSFRRWFIRKAKEALDAGAVGFTAWTLADVVGHDDEGMKDILRLTMKHYPGPSGDAARIACVEAVKLPV